MNQLKIHYKIDQLITQRPSGIKSKDIHTLITVNNDAKDYFFYKADERWLDWLYNNGFFETLKNPPKDPNQYDYIIPELDYLIRMAEKIPDKVVNIMLKIPISKETANPIVINKFITICTVLPPSQLKRVVPKIYRENWVSLNKEFINHKAFEFNNIFQKLIKAQDYKSIITLAKVVLSIKSISEIENKEPLEFLENPFYFSDILETGVFDALLSINDGKYIEKAFGLAIHTFKRIIIIYNKLQKENKQTVFEIDDGVLSYTIDFFKFHPGMFDKHSLLYNANALLTLLTGLAQKIFSDLCPRDKTKLRDVFNKYVGHFRSKKRILPDSYTSWRLRLFILSLCPQAFRKELKDSLFRLFETKDYYEIIGGAEYYKALEKSFNVLTEKEKREYVKNVIDYFKNKIKNTSDQKEQSTYITRASAILSTISSHLTEKEKELARVNNFTLKLDFKATPSVKVGEFKEIIDKAPVTKEQLAKYTVPQIARLLENEWSPEKLAEYYPRDIKNFYSPVTTIDVGNLLKEDISKRPEEYVKHAKLFFNPDLLDSHYTYSYLEGIRELITTQDVKNIKVDWGNIIGLLLSIKDVGKSGRLKDTQNKRTYTDRRANWINVHLAMADLIQSFLDNKNGLSDLIFSKYRNEFLEILKYLLTHPDPTPEVEKPKNAKAKVKLPNENQFLVMDPFTIAINSVRGRAFEALLLFVYLDTKRFDKDSKIKIATDVKNLYETTLKNENTRAIMFLFGYYLASFYYRDTTWIKKLLPVLFSKKQSRKDLYTAAWEGYLSNNLYKDLFFDKDIQELYLRGLRLKRTDFPRYQKHFKDPFKALAQHLALAFIYFEEFDLRHELFQAFWKTKNQEMHKEFISFIGKHLILRDSPRELIKKQKINIQKLKAFWDWALKHCTPQELEEFGTWINAKEGPFEISWLAKKIKETLYKTHGNLKWEFGLENSIEILAEKAPKDTLSIIKTYILEGQIRNPQKGLFFTLSEEWYSAIKRLYQIQDLQRDVIELIDQLIAEGGRKFWELKKILSNKSDEHM